MRKNRNLYGRVAKLEEKANPKEPVIIRVYMAGEDGLLRRHNEAGEVIETLTLEQFEQLPGETIHVGLKTEEAEQ